MLDASLRAKIGRPSPARHRLSWRMVAIGLLALVFLSSACGPDRNPTVKADATTGYCPVCKMMVYAAGEWTAEIHFNDGTKLMFESPADLLAFYTEPDRYKVTPAQQVRGNISRISLKDYQTKASIDGSRAALVVGSRQEGPMGPDFLAFEKRADADAFAAANGGRVIGLGEVTPEIVRNLRKSP